LELDEFPSVDGSDQLEEAKKEAKAVQQLQSLFKGLKFFVSREVPRESVVIVVRSCEGLVSWDSSLFPGASYDETDETITHQIVDRPSVDKQYLSRYYIQPQWVYDCINFRKLLPVEDYFIGAALPPHISPFVTERFGDYIPPEKQMLLAHERGETLTDKEDEEEQEEEVEESSDDDSETDKAKSESESKAVKEKNGMGVSRGVVEPTDTKAMEMEDKEHFRFRELMIPNKSKRLYRSMMTNRKKRQREAVRLEKKRKMHDHEAKAAQSKTPAKTTEQWKIQQTADGVREAKKVKVDE